MMPRGGWAWRFVSLVVSFERENQPHEIKGLRIPEVPLM